MYQSFDTQHNYQRMYAWIFKTTLVFCFTSWVTFENTIYAQQRFRNILGNDVILSQNPTEICAFQNSFIECAMKCELSSVCEAFNLRTYNHNTSTGLKMCELFDYKETDIFNQIQVENGSTYYEKVSCHCQWYLYHVVNVCLIIPSPICRNPSSIKSNTFVICTKCYLNCYVWLICPFKVIVG